jgi:hypothetical protein
MFKIWFNDGSKVSATCGGLNFINSKKELKKFSLSYDFNYDEVLNSGETNMLDEDGEIIGGVFRVKENG